MMKTRLKRLTKTTPAINQNFAKHPERRPRSDVLPFEDFSPATESCGLPAPLMQNACCQTAPSRCGYQRYLCASVISSEQIVKTAVCSWGSAEGLPELVRMRCG